MASVSVQRAGSICPHIARVAATVGSEIRASAMTGEGTSQPIEGKARMMPRAGLGDIFNPPYPYRGRMRIRSNESSDLGERGNSRDTVRSLSKPIAHSGNRTTYATGDEGTYGSYSSDGGSGGRASENSDSGGEDGVKKREAVLPLGADDLEEQWRALMQQEDSVGEFRARGSV